LNIRLEAFDLRQAMLDEVERTQIAPSKELSRFWDGGEWHGGEWLVLVASASDKVRVEW
jgi:hypothetical protein